VKATEDRKYIDILEFGQGQFQDGDIQSWLDARFKDFCMLVFEKKKKIINLGKIFNWFKTEKHKTASPDESWVVNMNGYFLGIRFFVSLFKKFLGSRTEDCSLKILKAIAYTNFVIQIRMELSGEKKIEMSKYQRVKELVEGTDDPMKWKDYLEKVVKL
jgi:hypothetical protein